MKTVMISGGFDPLHIGHLQLIQDAASIGRVVVAVNSDDWLRRKKGYVFMPFNDRITILSCIRGVFAVVPVIDSDDTVCESIRLYNPTCFANGGDRGEGTVPEQKVCEDMGIDMLWGVGGHDKPAASSDLVKEACKNLQAVAVERIINQR